MSKTTRKPRESSRTRPKHPKPTREQQTAWLRFGLTVWMLVAVVFLAAGLRLYHLDSLPPGLHTDEAANAWNGYCLLKTGTDQHGVAWPVSYLRAFGDNRSTLFLYFLLPFQAVGGLNVWTTRLPGAVGGIATVFLLYWIGTRLFDSTVGLVAAALLAVNPWHLQQCRWGHEASIVPLLIVLPMACMVWAGLHPFASNSASTRPKPVIAALAGVLAGAACYGYPAVRFFWPLFLLLWVVAIWRPWRAAIRAQGRKAEAVLLLSFLLIFLPLVWNHARDGAINKRAQTNWVWSAEDSFAQKAYRAAGRFPGHFGIDFLFVHGDPDIALSPSPGVGLFGWDSLVWMIFGFAFLIRTMPSSSASRWLAIWLLAYPAGDLLTRHAGLHALRSLPGVCALVLLSAIGMLGVGNWVRSRFVRKGSLGVALIGLVVAGLHLSFVASFFTGLETSPDKRRVMYMEDLLEASRWMKPLLGSVTAVFCTSSNMSHPYIYTLIGTEYEPAQWFRDQPQIVPGPLPGGAYENEEVCLGYGKIHFMHDGSFMTELRKLTANGRADRVLFAVRPGELGLEKSARPVKVFKNRFGEESLWIFDTQI